MSRDWRLLIPIVAIATIVLIAGFSYFSRMPLSQDATPHVTAAISKTATGTPIEIPEIARNEASTAQPISNPVAARPVAAHELWRVELELTKARMAREKESTVAAENIEETVQHAMFQEWYSEQLGLKDQQAWLSRPSHAKEIVFQDARIQKLLDSASEPEIAEQIKNEIERGFDHYLNELPLINEGDRVSLIGETVSGSPGVGVAAILYAELAEDADALPLIVKLHEHRLDAARAYVDGVDPERSNEYIGSSDGAMFAEAEIILMDRMLEDTQINSSAGGELAALLAEYEALRSSNVFKESRSSNGAFCLKQEHMLDIARRVAAAMSQ